MNTLQQIKLLAILKSDNVEEYEKWLKENNTLLQGTEFVNVTGVTYGKGTPNNLFTTICLQQAERIWEFTLNKMKDGFDYKDGNGDTPLLCAATYGTTQMLNFIFFNKEVDLYQLNKDGDNFATILCKLGRDDCIYFCLSTPSKAKKDFDWTTKNGDGKTPLDISIEKGINVITNYLLDYINGGQKKLPINEDLVYKRSEMYLKKKQNKNK